MKIFIGRSKCVWSSIALLVVMVSKFGSHSNLSDDMLAALAYMDGVIARSHEQWDAAEKAKERKRKGGLSAS